MSEAPACGPAVLTPAIPPPVAAILGNLVHTLLDSRQLRSFCPLPSWLLAAAASDGHSALPGGLSAVGWFHPRRLPSALADSSMCGQAPTPPRRQGLFITGREWVRERGSCLDDRPGKRESGRGGVNARNRPPSGLAGRGPGHDPRSPPRPFAGPRPGPAAPVLGGGPALWLPQSLRHGPV